MANPLLDAAKQYLADGFSPFPVEPRGKRPLVKWREYADTPPTAEQLEAWWTATPEANIGLALRRGQWVLDIDGDEGCDALAAAGVDIDALPFDCQVATGKGWHHYFSGDVPNGVGLLEKVDTRGYGGYVVAPPSAHPSGSQYAWALPMAFDRPPTAPPALLSLLQRAKLPTMGNIRPADNTDPVLAWANGVDEGRRDVTCTSAAGKLLGLGLAPETVEALLLPGADLCRPPFPPDQVAKCVASIAKRVDPAEVETVPTTLAEVLVQTMREVNRSPEERKRMMRGTALPGLDRFLSGGFEAGELVYISGTPGTGKTAFVMRLVRKAAETGCGVLVVSREMRAAALGRRMLVETSGVPLSDIKAGTLTDGQRTDLFRAQSWLSDLPIHVSAASTVSQIRNHVVNHAPPDLGLVAIDYLQLLNGEKGEEKRVRVEEISKELKALAVDHSVPVVCISSLRRLSRNKEGKTPKPEISDLRESGTLEFDGDVVLLLYREFGSDECEVIVGKARDGRVGTLKLRFRGETMRFEEIG